MRKNTASQVVAFQAVSTTDGSAVTTGTPTVYYLIDGGTQGTGSGTSTHEGNGCWSYVPAQAETNGNHVAFTFTLSGAVSQTVNVYPVSFDPTDSVRMGMTALPNAAADAAGGLPVSDAGGLDLDTMNSTINTTSSNVVTVDTVVDAIKVVTDAIGATGTGLTAIPWNAAWDAEVQSEVDDGLVARGLHYLVNTALPTNWSTDITANSALDYMADDGTAVYDRTTDSLQAIADSGGGGPTAAQIADAVWDEAQADHVAAGSFGEVATEVASILADTGTDGVVIAAGQSVASVTGAVGSVTGNVGGNVVGSVASVTGTVGGIAGTITTLDALDTAQDTQHSNTQAAISALNNLSAADVNAQVVDALATDTYAEPGAVPAATASLADKIGWVYTVSRNKLTQTATTTAVRNDADGANIATATVSDDGTTFVRSEFS